MSAVSDPTSAAPRAPNASPNFRLARFEDYSQIARLLEANDLQSQPEEDWKSVWLKNPLWPALANHWPIGWVLEDGGGKIVGSVMNVPSLYRLGDRQLLCANGRAWVAAPEYRGFSLMLMDEYFNFEGADLFINTTVGPMAVEILSALSSRLPLGDWESIAYWVTGYSGFARRALEKMNVPLRGVLAAPAGLALRLKDALAQKPFPDAPGGFAIDMIGEFDSRFEDFWQQLLRQNPQKLLAARDVASLAWHYAIPLRRKRLWIATATRNGRLVAWCVFKRHDQAQGIQRIRLIDFQTVEPDADLLPPLLHAALKRCAAENIDILDHLGCGLPKMRRLDELAPYRQKASNWPFYYRTNDPALQQSLAHPEIWDPSSFDGDASFE